MTRARVAELADAQDLGSCAARREGSTPSSRISPSRTVNMRQNRESYKAKPSSTPVDPIRSSRLHPTGSAPIRPSTATPNATRDCEVVATADDPDLAAVVAAWPKLPEAIRAGVLALVKAA
jgi:hypothetical protein